jgi:hypothetical protein
MEKGGIPEIFCVDKNILNSYGFWQEVNLYEFSISTFQDK